MNKQIRLYQIMHEEYSALKDGMYRMERELTALEEDVEYAQENSVKLISGEQYFKTLQMFRSELESSNIYLRKLTNKVKSFYDLVYGEEDKLNFQEIKALKLDTEYFLEQYNKSFSCIQAIRREIDKLRIVAKKELDNPRFSSGKLRRDLQNVLAQSMYVNRIVDSMMASVTNSFQHGNLKEIIEADSLLSSNIKVMDSTKRSR